MALFRALNRELAASDEEDDDARRERDSREVDRGNVQDAAAVVPIPRSGTREVIFLTNEERRSMFNARRPAGARLRRGEVPRGQQRERIVRELRSVRVRFVNSMSSEEILRSFRDAFSPYEVVGGARVNRPTNHTIRRLLRAPSVR